ncbi:dual OB domain-containing protein [Shewanella sp. WPAGA9]|uniref:dual OB domain-containing protein n=1 Tax=Shewanella sp. ENK2 TaxID=2775245 RepID=UPI001785F212|nr:hypothetical protein [Shewanella sp. WPAGA9]
MSHTPTPCTLVVLANSVKHGQCCVAGKRLDTKEWVRPVANASGAELTCQQASAMNPYGVYKVKPLQKVQMGFENAVPLKNQPENHLINREQWVQQYNIAPAELNQFLDTPASLWGCGDRVSYQSIMHEHVVIEESLQLVKVDQLMLYVDSNDKRRASFLYNGIQYDLAATDPNFDTHVNNQGELMSILCISLGEPFNGSCFKLVAAIY